MSVNERVLFLGIDPGASGGLAILDENGGVVLTEKMPETERDISDVMAEFGPRIRMAVIEHVHSMPKQGVVSSFKFGMSYGSLRMALIAHDVPFQAITPQTWQKELRCVIPGRSSERGTTEKKQLTKARAQELFPGRKVTHAIADALLLAEYTRRSHK